MRLWQATGAVVPAVVDWHGVAAAAHFGDAAAEYRALRETAAVVELPAWTWLDVRGADRVRFLHAMCTADIKRLAVGTATEAFFTDAKGHVLAHALIAAGADNHRIVTTPGVGERLVRHLDRYILREQVELRDDSATLYALAVVGPRAADALRAAGCGNPPDGPLGYACPARATTGDRIDVLAWPLTTVPALFLAAEASTAAAVAQALLAAGAVACGALAFEALRIESGWPWTAVDLPEKCLPQEVARDAQAISFTKGCYIGQETVARLDALGHVNKTLAGLRFDSAAPPPAGTELTAAGQPAGHLTSAARVPGHDMSVALGYLRRGSQAPGTRLDSPAGPATVVALAGH